MDRYFCHLCNKTITFGESHLCFLYRNYDNVHPLQLDELHKKDAKNDKSKYGCTGNLIHKPEKVCPVFQKGDADESKKMNFLPYKDNEQLTFKRDLKRIKTFSLLPDESYDDAEHANLYDDLQLDSTSNILENRVYSTENSSFKGLSDNFEPGYHSKSGFCLQYKKKPGASGDLYQQNKYEPKPSTSFQPPFSEEWEVSIEERKGKHFTNDEMKFKESVAAVPKAPFHSKNILQTKKTDKDPFKESRDLEHTSISSKVSPQMLGRSEEICDNVKQTLDSFKAKSAVSGPSGIRTDFLRGERRPFVCDICHIEFDWKSKFEQHYRTHTGEKPFQCNICSKRFSQRGPLNYHYKTHSGEKPFVCDTCGEAFAKKSNRDNHCRTHTGEKPFECDICKKCFARGSTLANHIMTHTGEKSYKCSICGKAFSRNSMRNRHYLTIHK